MTNQPASRAHLRARHSIDERFWAFVDKTETCWLWTGARTEKGYGTKVRFEGRAWYTHQLAYILSVGPIPEGLVIDHLCRVRHCVNPDHLEPVTARENTRRGVVARDVEPCPNGHPPTLRSVQPLGKKRCTECEREGGRRYYERHADEVNARRRARYAARRAAERHTQEAS